ERPDSTQTPYQAPPQLARRASPAIRMFEVRRTWPETPPSVEGVKVVEEFARGTADNVAVNGRCVGYGSWRYENGDMSFAEWQNINQAVTNPDGSRKATFTGTYLMTGGTGKLRGLEGYGSCTGRVE